MFSISSRRSRSRIKLLEADPSATQRLVHIVGQRERQVEHIVVVVDIVDDPPVSIPSPESKETPRVTPAQRRMAADLNALPQLKKELVFIPDVYNPHATIIARDIQNYEFHRIGEGVLRHWADAFMM
jgi:hypothetical protein